VRNFVEKLDILPGTYIYTVVTMGAPLGLGTVSAMNKALAAKGLKLNYGKGVVMPSNNVMLYNPAPPEKGTQMKARVDAQLREIAAEITAEKQKVTSVPFTLNALYKNISQLDKAFAADDNCISCGQCKEICPVRNITLEGGKPAWQGRCEHCAACISWCPKTAIQYGTKTQNRRRYRNPDIKVAQIIPNRFDDEDEETETHDEKCSCC